MQTVTRKTSNTNNAVLVTADHTERFSWTNTATLEEVTNKLECQYGELVVLARQGNLSLLAWVDEEGLLHGSSVNERFFSWSRENLGMSLRFVGNVVLTIEEGGETIALPSLDNQEDFDRFFRETFRQ